MVDELRAEARRLKQHARKLENEGYLLHAARFDGMADAYRDIAKRIAGGHHGGGPRKTKPGPGPGRRPGRRSPKGETP